VSSTPVPPPVHQTYGVAGAPPIPDPTTLTTAALEREIFHLRELLEANIAQVSKHLDTADAQLLALLTSQIVDLRRLVEESDLRYQQRYDAQTKALDAARVAADLAVQAALVAAEKAVSKAEVAAEKRFDVVSEKVDDVKNSTSAQIAAIQSQLATMAGRGAGAGALWGYIAAGIFLVIAVVTFVNNQP
jgi:hypothetical protein